MPWFAPDEARVCAPILILQQSPGPKALQALGGSEFASPDNNDDTAANMWRLLRDAGVERACDVAA